MALLEATNDWSVDIDNGLLNGVVSLYLLKHLTALITRFPWVRCFSWVLTGQLLGGSGRT